MKNSFAANVLIMRSRRCICFVDLILSFCREHCSVKGTNYSPTFTVYGLIKPIVRLQLRNEDTPICIYIYIYIIYCKTVTQ